MPKVSAVGAAKPAGRRVSQVIAKPAEKPKRVVQQVMREALDKAKADGTTDRGLLQAIVIKARADFLAGRIE